MPLLHDAAPCTSSCFGDTTLSSSTPVPGYTLIPVPPFLSPSTIAASPSGCLAVGLPDSHRESGFTQEEEPGRRSHLSIPSGRSISFCLPLRQAGGSLGPAAPPVPSSLGGDSCQPKSLGTAHCDLCLPAPCAQCHPRPCTEENKKRDALARNLHMASKSGGGGGWCAHQGEKGNEAFRGICPTLHTDNLGLHCQPCAHPSKWS